MGGVSRFSSKSFCLTVLKFSVGETFTVALSTGIEKIWVKEWGVSTISVENFLSHSAEKFRKGHFTVSLILGIENFYVSEGYVTIFDFSVKLFLSHRAENSVDETFCAVFQKVSVSKTVCGLERGGEANQDFPSKFFCPTVPKFSFGESFTVDLSTGIEKVCIKEGGVSRLSVEIFLPHSAEKFRYGTV